MNTDRRFIEDSFPVKEVSKISAKEKNIRHGHISTLHIWWARRPLASSRATSFAALIPAVKNPEEWNKIRNFIIEFSKWENSLNKQMIEKARRDILKTYNGEPPKILDPFAGGGSIPLEALRLGCKVYAGDYNPVAVLILKCTLEYPQKYGKPKKVKVKKGVVEVEEEINPLLEDVKKWGNWVLDEAKKEIGKFYPKDPDGSIPVGYIWARTIPCQNPNCGTEIPLMRQFWLAKKSNKKVALYPYVEGKQVKFKIVGTGYEKMPNNFSPEKGTVSRAIVTCPVCRTTIDANTTRRLFQEGKSGQRMIAVILHKPGEQGKKYRLATEKDLEIYRQAEKYLEEKREKLRNEWGIDPVPDEDMNTKDPTTVAGRGYGIRKWGDLFNSRQKLALITFVEKIRSAYKKMVEDGLDKEYAKAVVGYLGLGISRSIPFYSVLTRWEPMRETPANVFGRQALPMMWDFTGINPFSGATGGVKQNYEWIVGVLFHIFQIPESQVLNVGSQIIHSSATQLPYPDNFFDAVFTDPPYYDNINYAELSDFFYVWLKRCLGDLYPELFSTPLVPKSQEIVANPIRHGDWEKSKKFFEDMLKKAFCEIQRVLKPNGIAVIVYAHKSTAGWETLINSLLSSGLLITSAWPINTEMESRLLANESAALASSIYIVARKIKREKTAFYNDVKQELKTHLIQKLDRLWNEGVSGADFFISAIGASIEIFGKYEKILDFEGNQIKADKLLDEVRKIVTDYAVRKILHNGFSEDISDLTRFYVLFRFNFGNARVHFDEARRIALGCNIDLSLEWNRRGFIKKQAEFIKVLGPQERKLEEIEDTKELIDVLHKTLILWEKGKKDEYLALLKETGFGKSDAFYRVAQAISEVLPKDDKEKKLLDGFLSGRERIKEELIKEKPKEKQRRLF
ncbi:DUF1156 domain-containing protein [bacterium]|nr:DUF1156 domain-containing protein [bacterium]